MDTARAGTMLERARWAADAFAEYDRSSVDAIVSAVVEVAAENARHYADWAVRETRMGVVADKESKNLACSTGLLEEYKGSDFITPRVDEARRLVEIPRPSGVVLALTPSTNPVASVYFKVLLALMTRNAVVVAPHPRARECCADAARKLAAAAVEAGAPNGVIQVIDEPTIPLLEAFMKDSRTGVIVATGGGEVVRAAYSSGNPALGVGPGNVPVFVDATADVQAAAQKIVDSKSFDNSVLCTNESVLIAEDAVADKLLSELKRAGAYILGETETAQLRGYLFPDGHLNKDAVGQDAVWIAQQAGMRVTPKTKLLVAPIEMVLEEELLAHEKLSPVIAMTRVPNADKGIDTARAVVRIAGPGHSAAIYSENPGTILEFGKKVPVLRVSVNVGNSLGSSGITTNLALSMTIGTGFIGNSSLGENLQPKHLIDWQHIAYDSAPEAAVPSFADVDIWSRHHGPVPEYPMASNARAKDAGSSAANVQQSVQRQLPDNLPDQIRAELRRIVSEELSQLIKE